MYLVIGADGQRYGPADEALLARWAQEGRLVGGSILIDTEHNRQCAAITLPAVRAALYSAGGEAPFEQTQTAMPSPGGAAAPGPMRPAAGSGRAATTWPPIPPVPPQPHPAPVAYTVSFGRDGEVGDKSKVAAGILGILFGGLGAHRFYLGYPGVAVLMILANVFCGLGIVWGMIEGVLCLCGKMRDADGRLLRD